MAVSDVSGLRSPRLVKWLDRAIAFVALERSIILRNVAILSSGKILPAFSSMFRLFIVNLAHVFLYWAISRPMPGTISYLDYNAPAFATWMIFSDAIWQVTPVTFGSYFNKSQNIKWINLLIADIAWNSTKITLGTILTYLFFIIIPFRYLGSVSANPNIQLLVYVCFLALAMGVGIGLSVKVARQRWPIIEAVMETVMWLLFVTSGIYESYIDLPPAVADIFKWNPIMATIEFGRVALDRGYPVNGLSLTYSSIAALTILLTGLLLRRWDALNTPL